MHFLSFFAKIHSYIQKLRDQIASIIQSNLITHWFNRKTDEPGAKVLW